MKRNVSVVVALVLFLSALVSVTTVFVNAQQRDEGRATAVWQAGEPMPPAPARPPKVTLADLPAGCPANPKPIVPTSFSIERLKVNSHVLSLGYDPKTGAALAPPDKDAFGVGWLNEGPKPGSKKGHIVLTAHTYHVGKALGNLLYDSKRGLKAGDIIKMSDDAGNIVCYKVRESLKVWLKDYDSQPSNIVYDDEGRPQLVMVLCWDWDWTARRSQSRIVFYADPLVS